MEGFQCYCMCCLGMIKIILNSKPRFHPTSPVSHASRGHQHREGGKHPTSPSIRGQSQGCVCFGENKHGWYMSPAATTAGVAAKSLGSSWTVLEWDQRDWWNCATTVGSIQGWRVVRTCCSDSNRFSTYVSGCGILQNLVWAKPFSQTVWTVVVYWCGPFCGIKGWRCEAWKETNSTKAPSFGSCVPPWPRMITSLPGVSALVCHCGQGYGYWLWLRICVAVGWWKTSSLVI